VCAKFHWRFASTRATCLTLALLAAAACSDEAAKQATQLEAVKHRGELVVLTRNSPTTYYEGPDGPTGFEYDLAKAFANALDVDLRIVAVASPALGPKLAAGAGDFIAAGLAITPERLQSLRFTPPYQEVRQQLVYRLGNERPQSPAQLVGHNIEVVANSPYVERLKALQAVHPGIDWIETDDEVEDLLIGVWEGLVELTVADSNIVALNRQYYPELQIALDLNEPQHLAWAFRNDGDDSLYRAASDFLQRARKDGTLAYLIERYYGPSLRFNYFNTATYIDRIDDTLPRYRHLFQRAGGKYNLDWRLLAAVGYQESYWDPRAISPTGVRGLMMLTERTSMEIGVVNREDAAESIDGGARYLRTLIDRMPPRVAEPDRTWMALAAYNVGINHLEDARIITQRHGRDPNKWLDVETYLPYLTKPGWYEKTRFGYARGHEPVQYVHRIRAYYDILVKIDEERRSKQRPLIQQLRAPAI